MKVLITGHTHGLGKAIARYFESQDDYDVLGMSRSTGHDIIDPSTSVAITDECPDVFINNAWSHADPWAQFRLMSELMTASPSTIHVVIGTRATDWGIGARHPLYEGSKEALHRLARHTNTGSHHRCLLIRPGLLDVPKFINNPKPKLDPTHIAEFIGDWLNGPSYMRHISEIIMTPEMAT